MQCHGQVFVAGRLLGKLGSQAEEQAKPHTAATEEVRDKNLLTKCPTMSVTPVRRANKPG